MTELVKAMDVEVYSLLHVLQYLVPEQIDYNKESNCIHATVD
jgi:hypothetical protein